MASMSLIQVLWGKMFLEVSHFGEGGADFLILTLFYDHMALAKFNIARYIFFNVNLAFYFILKILIEV